MVHWCYLLNKSKTHTFFSFFFPFLLLHSGEETRSKRARMLSDISSSPHAPHCSTFQVGERQENKITVHHSPKELTLHSNVSFHRVREDTALSLQSWNNSAREIQLGFTLTFCSADTCLKHFFEIPGISKRGFQLCCPHGRQFCCCCTYWEPFPAESYSCFLWKISSKNILKAGLPKHRRAL